MFGQAQFRQTQFRQTQRKAARLFGAAVVIGAVAAAGLPVAQAAAVGTPPEVTLSITPSKKNVRPGQQVTFTVTATHPTGVVLSYPGSPPYPLWYPQFPGLINNTCYRWDTSQPGTQTCSFTIVPNLAKGERMTVKFSALQRWAEAPYGMMSRPVEATTTIRGVGGGNR